MEKCGEITCEPNSGLGLFRLGFWLLLALLLYVLSIGPAVRFGGNNSEVAILLYKPVGWACHQSGPFDTLVTRWIKLWDRGPVPAGAARYGANRVAGRITLPAPTPPDMRVRIRRFRLD